MHQRSIPSHRARRWSPRTELGRWAAGLAGLALCGTVAVAIAFALGVESGESFSDKPLLTLIGTGVLACAGGAVVTGALAQLRQRERSWLVVVATLLGAVVTALMLQQVAEGLGWASA